MELVAAGADIIIIALIAWVLLLGYYMLVNGTFVVPLRELGNAEHSVLGSIPVIGGLITGGITAIARGLANGIEAATSAAAKTAGAWAESAIHPIVALLYVSANLSRQMWEATIGAIEDTITRIDHLATVTIPDTEQYLLAQMIVSANNAEGAAKSYADGLIGDAETAISSVAASAEAQLHNVVAGVDAEIGAAFTAVDNRVTAMANQVAGQAAQLERDMLTVVGNELARAESAEGTIAAAGAAALAGAVGTIEGQLGDIVRGLSGNITAGDVATATVAAAATAVVAADLAKEVESCIKPMCDGFGGFTNLLTDLLALFETGALLALVAEAVTDPQGAAHRTEGLVEPMVGELRGALHSLTGVG